jgi:hypothetical protein
MLSSTLQVFSPYCFLLEYCGTVRNLCIQQVLPGGTGSVKLLIVGWGARRRNTRSMRSLSFERYEHLSSYQTHSQCEVAHV